MNNWFWKRHFCYCRINPRQYKHVFRWWNLYLCFCRKHFTPSLYKTVCYCWFECLLGFLCPWSTTSKSYSHLVAIFVVWPSSVCPVVLFCIQWVSSRNTVLSKKCGTVMRLYSPNSSFNHQLWMCLTPGFLCLRGFLWSLMELSLVWG